MPVGTAIDIRRDLAVSGLGLHNCRLSAAGRKAVAELSTWANGIVMMAFGSFSLFRPPPRPSTGGGGFCLGRSVRCRGQETCHRPASPKLTRKPHQRNGKRLFGRHLKSRSLTVKLCISCPLSALPVERLVPRIPPNTPEFNLTNRNGGNRLGVSDAIMTTIVLVRPNQHHLCLLYLRRA